MSMPIPDWLFSALQNAYREHSLAELRHAQAAFWAWRAIWLAVHDHDVMHRDLHHGVSSRKGERKKCLPVEEDGSCLKG